MSAIKDAIDNDQGLKRQRNFLVGASMLLIAMTLSGATITEANTFLFKIEFQHAGNIPALIAAAIIYLLVRYYSYAHIHHQALYELWTKRLLLKIIPVFLGETAIPRLLSKKISSFDPSEIKELSYECRFVFIRLLKQKIRFEDDGIYQYNIYDTKLNSSTKDWKISDYASLLGLEFKYQFSSLIQDREHLDLLAPYAIGIIALAIYGWHVFLPQ